MILNYFIALIFGILIGNFTTTLLYRLPRGITIFGFDEERNQPPICSHCGARLKFYEYLPVLSWISTLGYCNYCKKPIDKSYMFLEMMCGFISVVLFYFMHFSEQYLLVLTFASITTLQIALYRSYCVIWPITIYIQVVTGLIFQTLIYTSISQWIINLFVGTVLLVALSKKIHMPIINHMLIIVLSSWGNVTYILLYAILCVAIALANHFMRAEQQNEKLHYYFSITYIIMAVICIHII